MTEFQSCAKELSSATSGALRKSSSSFQAPSGFSESDGEEEGAVQSRRRSSIGVLRALSPMELALTEVTSRLDRQLLLSTQKQLGNIEHSLAEVDVSEAAAIKAAREQRQYLEDAFAQQNLQSLQLTAGGRKELLQRLRSRHAKEEVDAQTRVAQKLEEIRQKKEAEVQRLENEHRAREEATKKAADLEARKKIENEQKAREIEKSRALPLVTGAPSALENEKTLAGILSTANNSVAAFLADATMRDKKRAIDKFITLNVQQISATLDQVRSKSLAICNFLRQQHDPLATYALLTLASKIISQCEVQITRLHSFAFPLGEVVVAVGIEIPAFLNILIAKLQAVCPLVVPKYVGFRQGMDEDAYLKSLGYKIHIDEDTSKVVKESTDEFVGRMQGYIMLHAAITQSSHARNPHGLAFAWKYMARALNSLPANRLTATAIDAFLRIAGYHMASAYKEQFNKLLFVLENSYLAELRECADPDAKAVYSRIQTYLKSNAWRSPPEGRDMPEHDASSYNRA